MPKCVQILTLKVVVNISLVFFLKSLKSSDSSKLESYKQICSDLFESFDRDVRMDSYHDLVQSMIEWQGEFSCYSFCYIISCLVNPNSRALFHSRQFDQRG